MTRRPHRWERYQYLFYEISVAPDHYSLTEYLLPDPENAVLQEERDRLIRQLWERYQSHLWPQLTDRQKEYLEAYCRGMTQDDAARYLGVNQSSYTKALHGNRDYQRQGKRYGGVFPKLRRLAAADPEIQEILAQLRELSE